MSSPHSNEPTSKRTITLDDIKFAAASQRPKRRCVPLSEEMIQSFYAPGGAFNSQTTDSQWSSAQSDLPALAADIPFKIQAQERKTSTSAGVKSTRTGLDSVVHLAGDGGLGNWQCSGNQGSDGLGVYPLPPRPCHDVEAPILGHALCNNCGSSAIDTVKVPSTHELPEKRECGVQTTPYAGCTIEHLKQRLNLIECMPRYDADGHAFVPDSEGESNEELRMPDPLRRPRLFRRTVPTAEYPGTWQVYEKLRRSREDGRLSLGEMYPGRCALVDKVELQNMARKIYLQRVLDGLEPEPSDKELRYVMRPYSIVSSFAD